jgi:folate-binding Fe-S cluster repair protein YgfZ
MTDYQILQRGLLKITGEDAAKFLQALITNDIYSNHNIYAMILSPQGRYLFDFFVSNIREECRN